MKSTKLMKLLNVSTTFSPELPSGELSVFREKVTLQIKH